MKKFVAILVAAMMLLSGLTAFAGVAEEQSAIISLINAGVTDPNAMLNHALSIDSLTADELAAVEANFNAIDAAIKVAIDNVDVNLAGSQMVTLFANLNAIARAYEMSYEWYLEVPVAALAFALEDEDVVTEGWISAKEQADLTAAGYTYVIVETETEMVKVATDELILDKGFTAVWDAAWAEVLNTFSASGAYYHYIYDGSTYAAGNYTQLAWTENDKIVVLDSANAAVTGNTDIELKLFCEENGVCIAPNGYLASVWMKLSDFEVTGKDAIYAAVSPFRTWFGKFATALKAMAATNPAAAAPVVEDTAAADRLPDTATSYGNLVVMGVVMMVVAAAAVVGIKKVAFNA